MSSTYIKELAAKSSALKTDLRDDIENDLARLEDMRAAWGSQYFAERVVEILAGKLERDKLHYGEPMRGLHSRLNRIRKAINNNGMDIEAH